MKNPNRMVTVVVAAAMGAAGGVSMSSTIKTDEVTSLSLLPGSVIAFNSKSGVGDDAIYETIGELYFKDGEFRFKGNAADSADMFFNDLIMVMNGHHTAKCEAAKE